MNLIQNEYVLLIENDDGKLTLEGDVIVNICQDKSDTLSSNIQFDQLGEDLMEGELKKESKYVSTSDQMINLFKIGTTEMGCDIVALTNVLPP